MRWRLIGPWGMLSPTFNHKGAIMSLTKRKPGDNGPLTGEVTERNLFPDAVEESPIVNPFDPDRIRIGRTTETSPRADRPT